MKDFDEFRSWIEIDKRFLKGCKKLLFDKDYLWIKDEKLLSSVFVFYYTYYHFGIEFLLEKAEEANYPPWRKNTIIQLINLCQDIVHEMNMEFYEENIFTWIDDIQVQNIIRDYSPITEDSIKEYIMSDNTNLLLKAKTIGYMITTINYLSEKTAFAQYFFVGGLGLLMGRTFEELFSFISLNNPTLYKYLLYIKKYISKGFHASGFFDEYDSNEDFDNDPFYDGDPLYYIHRNFFHVKTPKVILADNEISWKFVTFLNGELQIYNPKHPEGQGKYKPFYFKNQKSIKAFNQIKDYIINKLPPIKAVFQDDIIVGIEPSSIESINDTLDVLKRHTENVAHISEDIHKSEREKLLKHEYTQSEVRNYINNKKSEFLDSLCQLHLDDYKIYYRLENRVNSDLIMAEEDAFIFTIATADKETLLAYENTEENRATYLFICDSKDLEMSVRSLADYFSSGLVNKRETLGNKIKYGKITGIKKLIKITHSDEWLREIKSEQYKIY